MYSLPIFVSTFVKMKKTAIPSFVQLVIPWYLDNKRPLPWRDTKDPYAIWISEIILQQTRVQQGMAYYHRLLEQFPTVQDLAHAPEDQLFRVWQGLGYYSRARNLQLAAKKIVGELGGLFPTTYEEWLTLPGVSQSCSGRKRAALGLALFGIQRPHRPQQHQKKHPNLTG